MLENPLIISSEKIPVPLPTSRMSPCTPSRICSYIERLKLSVSKRISGFSLSLYSDKFHFFN